MTIKALTNLNDVKKLLQCVQRRPEVTYSDIAKELSISTSTVKRMRKKVKSLGVVIDNLGTTRKPCYEITAWGLINEDEVMQETTPEVCKISTEQACLEKEHAYI